MTWTPTDLIDKTDGKYGVVATVPIIVLAINIWQDSTNPPTNPLDIDAMRPELAKLEPGFYSMPELHIFAEVIDARAPQPLASNAAVEANGQA